MLRYWMCLALVSKTSRAYCEIFDGARTSFELVQISLDLVARSQGRCRRLRLEIQKLTRDLGDSPRPVVVRWVRFARGLVAPVWPVVVRWVRLARGLVASVWPIVVIGVRLARGLGALQGLIDVRAARSWARSCADDVTCSWA